MKKIFFTCLQLSKNGVKIIESGHIIRPIVASDYNKGEHAINRSDYVRMYGNLMIEKVKCWNQIICNIPTKKKDIGIDWANEFPTNVIESKVWNYKKSTQVKKILIKRMDAFLDKWATTDVKARDKLKAKWEQWKQASCTNAKIGDA